MIGLEIEIGERRRVREPGNRRREIADLIGRRNGACPRVLECKQSIRFVAHRYPPPSSLNDLYTSVMGRFVASLVLGAGVVLLSAQAQPSAADLAKQLQAHYDTIKSFTADLTRTSRPAGVPQTTTDHGTVKVMKPGRINFATAPPDESQTVSDGAQIINWLGG